MADRLPHMLVYSSEIAPWGIEFVAGPDGNYWKNEWHVRTDGGEGTHLATFEFPDHAEAFVAAFGPRGEVVYTDGSEPYSDVNRVMDALRAHLAVGDA